MSPSRNEKTWRSWKLHWGTLCVLSIIEIAIVASLSILIHLSDKNAGFTSIKQMFSVNVSIDNLSVHSFWSEGFLWTTLPTLLMTLYRLSWSSVVDTLADETPFRELAKQGECSMKKSILLDYRKYSSFYGWCVAFKNGHLILGLCMALALINTIVLVPLSARLFAAVNVKVERETPFQLTTSYNDSRIVASIDYAPILATVSAVRVHGGNWPLWTNGSYAFPTFTIPANASAGVNITQSSLNITAYSANLSCEVVTDYLISRINADGGRATITITANDRGCDISIKGGVGPDSKVFLKTNSIIDCSAESGYSRISFFAGSYLASAPYLLDNMNVISCIPSYTETPGVVTAPPSLQPLSFDPHLDQSVDARPSNWRGFEQNMLSLSNIGDSDSPDFTSGFGDLMLSFASVQDPSSTLSSKTLVSSTTTVFTSIFAVLAATQLFQTLATPSNTIGLMTISDTRLQVVSWSAYITIAILCILIVHTAILIFYLPENRSILREEPRGILGAASLLYGSNVNPLLLDPANRSKNYEGHFHEWLEKTYVLGLEKCTFVAGRIIEVQNLVPKPQVSRDEERLLRDGDG